MTLKKCSQPSKKCMGGFCACTLVCLDKAKEGYDSARKKWDDKKGDVSTSQKVCGCCSLCCLVPCVAGLACEMAGSICFLGAPMSSMCAMACTVVDNQIAPCGEFCYYYVDPAGKMTCKEKVNCGLSPSEKMLRLEKQALLDNAGVQCFKPRETCREACFYLCTGYPKDCAKYALAPITASCDMFEMGFDICSVAMDIMPACSADVAIPTKKPDWLKDLSKVSPGEEAPKSETMERGKLTEKRFNEVKEKLKNVMVAKEALDKAKKDAENESKVCRFLKNKSVYW